MQKKVFIDSGFLIIVSILRCLKNVFLFKSNYLVFGEYNNVSNVVLPPLTLK